MVLSRPDAETPADPSPPSDLLDMNVGPPTTVEDKNSTLKTKRDKEAGINIILAEMLKVKSAPKQLSFLTSSLLCGVTEDIRRLVHRAIVRLFQAIPPTGVESHFPLSRVRSLAESY